MLDYVKYEKRFKYPHMAPLDVAIWERFIFLHPEAFEVVAYDVAVGEGSPHDTVVNPETGGDINRAYQRRIDVVAKDKSGSTTIIELKPRATTSALGQIKGYALLFARDFGGGALKKLIITDELMPEMKFLADSEGVEVLVV